MGEMRNTSNISGGKPQRKILNARSRLRCEGKIKRVIKEIRY
jgi:hypothetical protein